VLSKEIESHHLDEHDQKTFRYNTILSDSVFSLCPLGAGPNTLRFWESIAVGSIPVIFSNDLGIFNVHELGAELLKHVFYWDKPINLQLFDYLCKIDRGELENRSRCLSNLFEQVNSLTVMGKR
jgi:hypothetical protein